MVDAKHNSSAQIAMVVFMFGILFVVWMRCQFVAGSAVLSAARVRPTRLVVDSSQGVVHLFLVLGGQLRRPEVIVQLVDGSGEGERHFVAEIRRRSGIEPDVKGLV